MSIKKEADVSRRKRRGIKRILAMLVLRLAITLIVGSAIFFLIAKIIIDDEIDFSGNFSALGLAGCAPRQRELRPDPPHR